MLLSYHPLQMNPVRCTVSDVAVRRL